RTDQLIEAILMPGMRGLDAAHDIYSRTHPPKIVNMSIHDDDEYILKSVEVGASGYLLKDTSKEELLKAIRAIHQGGKYFSGDISNVLVNRYLNVKDRKLSPSLATGKNDDITKREKQILGMIADGMGNKEIAGQLGKSIRTIETHRFNIMKKLKVNNVVELLKKLEEEPGLKQFILNI